MERLNHAQPAERLPKVARLALPNRPGWNEHVLRVPAGAVSEGTTALELVGRYASFHYWFYQ